MFSINIRRVYYLCDKVLVRTLRGRGVSGPSVGPNPGLNNRLKAFRQEGVKITEEDTNEFLEKSESDFLASGDAYTEHLNETLMGKHMLRHQIIKEKYFKENMPNLLTWSEKEQIRHLNAEQPDEWTPERIAESFPVTASVAKKILKYPWKPSTELRIARHDASALRNWKELKEGTLEIPEDLRKHFLKFSERSIPPLDKKSLKTDLTQDKDMGEFQKIIDRCASKETIKENLKANFSKNDIETDAKEQSSKGYDKKEKKDYKRITLEELTNKIQRRLDKGKEVDLPDQIIAKSVASLPSATESELNQHIELEDAEEEKALSHVNEEKVVAIATYPERIRIPKKAYKRGATYKVNDCYYDDDGRFLYRVIGMTSS